jgi:hypothetical protein
MVIVTTHYWESILPRELPPRNCMFLTSVVIMNSNNIQRYGVLHHAWMQSMREKQSCQRLSKREYVKEAATTAFCLVPKVDECVLLLTWKFDISLPCWVKNRIGRTSTPFANKFIGAHYGKLKPKSTVGKIGNVTSNSWKTKLSCSLCIREARIHRHCSIAFVAPSNLLLAHPMSQKLLKSITKWARYTLQKCSVTNLLKQLVFRRYIWRLLSNAY